MLNAEASMVYRRPVELQISGPREWRSSSVTNGIAVRGRAFSKRPCEGWNDEEQLRIILQYSSMREQLWMDSLRVVTMK